MDLDPTREQETVLAELARLREEHQDLDAAVTALTEAAFRDQLQIQRLKKRKLQVKDRIRHLEDILIPDLPA